MPTISKERRNTATKEQSNRRIERLKIQKTADYVQGKFSGEGTGHDWGHIERVWKSARRIGRAEKADMFVVEMAALLHELDDIKINPKNTKEEPILARAWLKKSGVNTAAAEHILYIISTMSFRKNESAAGKNLEWKVVQDADRLEALGAIGIIRAITYGAIRNRPLYDPKIKPAKKLIYRIYVKRLGTTINHLYEKALVLKDKMNTRAARRLAVSRHKFVLKFLGQFYAEWDGRA